MKPLNSSWAQGRHWGTEVNLTHAAHGPTLQFDIAGLVSLRTRLPPDCLFSLPKAHDILIALIAKGYLVLLDDLNHGLVVSCQPVPDGPMDDAPSVVGFALAAMAGGAQALRIESLAYVRAVRARTAAPIIGIVKEDRTDTAVRITATTELAAALCDAGADIVAFDATRRPRPATVRELIATIKARGKLAMADCSDIEDAREALAAGADLVGTTLSGYTGGVIPTGPDLDLISAMRRLTPNVVAEGRIHTPAQAAEALRRGARCVVVGSALTRTEHATSWFRSAMDAAVPSRAETVLAIDIGGTKILAGLVEGDAVRSEVTLPTDQAAGPDAWLDAVAGHFSASQEQYSRVAVAVSGLVADGRWSALNPATLRLPADYRLSHRLEQLFGVPAFAANDAQAAAWGEYCYGAGEREDLVFLTISTGIGGGIVLAGRPLLGLAGHFGLLRSASTGGPIENDISGRWIAAQARQAGHDMTGAEVFAAAAGGQEWADGIIAGSARKVALLCADIQLIVDPRRIVMGGGIGLAAGFIARVERELAELQPRLRPNLVPARLGTRAGIVGVANLAVSGP
jgi:N-acetylmannosamine-6-phosphate 2-epimerase/N-acetylmannosamine kinase